MTATGTAREACERAAHAVMTGDLPALMTEITPEALAQLMQLGSTAQSIAITDLPEITGYTIVEFGQYDGYEIFNVTFTSTLGWATLASRWKVVLGQWKVTDVAMTGYEIYDRGGTAGGPS